MSDDFPFRLRNAEELAAESPYTFFIPSRAQREAVDVGDLAKLVFEYQWEVKQFGAERMWVKVCAREGAGYVGMLDNRPFEEGLEEGMIVNFGPEHIVAIEWDDEARCPPEEPHREYWQRCYVDRCVLSDGVPVEYIYREEPETPDEDGKDPDSGWRIRGRESGDPEDSLDKRKISYVALGVVLNRDDSFLPLIDAPVGSAFARNFESGEYEPSD